MLSLPHDGDSRTGTGAMLQDASAQDQDIESLPLRGGLPGRVRATKTHAATWNGMTAEVTELHGPGAYLDDLRARQLRLMVALEEVGGGDKGFLWRLHSYWRYERVDGGVLVSLESLTLRRDVPMLIKPLAGRIVPRIARESMVRTLDALKAYAVGPINATARIPSCESSAAGEDDIEGEEF